MLKIIRIFSLGFIFLVAACTSVPATTNPTEIPTDADAGMGPDHTQKYAPMVGAFYEGGDILFIHTEASDSNVATMLTEMMDGPLVVLVPELADAPLSLLANVYVFTNGLQGIGPFGFQPDIFDSVPGEKAYRPLRNVNLVEWSEDAAPRELSSVAELQEAKAAGEITITQPGIVVNMPVLVWPGGSR
jgi:hypothetical protein